MLQIETTYLFLPPALADAEFFAAVSAEHHEIDVVYYVPQISPPA